MCIRDSYNTNDCFGICSICLFSDVSDLNGTRPFRRILSLHLQWDVLDDSLTHLLDLPDQVYHKTIQKRHANLEEFNFLRSVVHRSILVFANVCNI